MAVTGGSNLPVRVNGQWRLPNPVYITPGSATSPGLAFLNDTGVGFYRQSANTIGAAGNLLGSGYGIFGAPAAVGWNGRAVMLSTANGVIQMFNAANTGFTRLTLGPQSSGMPVLEPAQAELASGSTMTIGTSNSQGTLFVANSTGAVAIYAIKGAQSTTQEIFDSGTLFSAVGATTNSFNVYWDSTTVSYSLENRTGTTGAVTTLFIGRRLT